MLVLEFKEDLNKKNILNKLKDQSLVYEYYLNMPIKEGVKYKSPLREDKDPSLTFKYYASTASWVWRDWGNTLQSKPLSIFDFVMGYYSCDFVTAMIHMNNDLGLGLEGSNRSSNGIKRFEGQNIPINKRIEKKKKRIRISFKAYTELNYKFWTDFGITKETLKLFNVFSLNKAWVNSYMIKDNKYNQNIFVYIINRHVKIYHPGNEMKFIGNVTLNDISGLDLLPENGERLIITKSHKDVMVLYEMGIPAIAPQGEGMALPLNMMKDLKNRFNNIYILYDNDNPGIKASNKENISFPFLKQIYIPKEICKDISELSFIKGLMKAKTILINSLW